MNLYYCTTNTLITHATIALGFEFQYLVSMYNLEESALYRRFLCFLFSVYWPVVLAEATPVRKNLEETEFRDLDHIFRRCWLSVEIESEDLCLVHRPSNFSLILVHLILMVLLLYVGC